VGAKIQECWTAANESWRNLDRTRALSVRPQEGPIRADCGALYEKLSQLTSASGDATAHVDLMMICRHLERILRHVACVADQAADAAPLGQAG
jgi:hypothetical protein